MKKALIVVCALGTLGWATAAKDYILKTKRLNSWSVALSCENRGDPTGTKLGDMLIISCGDNK